LAARRLVRFETGSRREAVFASHTVHIASGSADTRRALASDSMTGVSRTAVVSRLRPMVLAAAKTTHRTKSAAKLPRATIASRLATMSKSPATFVSSASTRTVARNSRIGRIRRNVASAPSFPETGSRPVAMKISPSTSSAIAIQSSTSSRFRSGRSQPKRENGADAGGFSVWASPITCYFPRPLPRTVAHTTLCRTSRL
jgi:hypothetical protein